MDLRLVSAAPGTTGLPQELDWGRPDAGICSTLATLLVVSRRPPMLAVAEPPFGRSTEERLTLSVDRRSLPPTSHTPFCPEYRGPTVTEEHLAKLQRWAERDAQAVRCVFSEVPAALPNLLEKLGERSQAFTLVSIQTEPGESLAEHLDSLVQVMAEAVLVRYPELYQSALTQLHAKWAQTEAQLAIEQVAHADGRVSPAWLRRALQACRQGQTPRLGDYSLAAEAEQLALCLDPERLVITWVVPPQPLVGAELLGIARAAEWLQASTSAMVLVALSTRWRGRLELDSISYDALHFVEEVAAAQDGPDGQTQEPEPPKRTRAASEDRQTREQPKAPEPGQDPPPTAQRPTPAPPRVTALWPFIGRPHPLSPAEQLFARALAADPELASKFAWNQVVRTEQGTRPIVDLVWTERRLAVEIDGFAHHSSRTAFEQDRQRDWELLVTGYRVFRIPASEVLSNTPASLEKLRVLTRSLAREAQ